MATPSLELLEVDTAYCARISALQPSDGCTGQPCVHLLLEAVVESGKLVMCPLMSRSCRSCLGVTLYVCVPLSCHCKSIDKASISAGICRTPPISALKQSTKRETQEPEDCGQGAGADRDLTGDAAERKTPSKLSLGLLAAERAGTSATSNIKSSISSSTSDTLHQTKYTLFLVCSFDRIFTICIFHIGKDLSVDTAFDSFLADGLAHPP
jgi:hypothetical protein